MTKIIIKDTENFDIFGLKELEIGEVYADWIFSVFKPYISERILEVGSGLGLIVNRLQNRELVVASDINDDFLRILKSKFKNQKNIEIFKLDIEKASKRDIDILSNKRIETIITVNTLEHIKDDFAALVNIHKILKENGRLIVFVPALGKLYGSLDRAFGHYRRYSKKDIVTKLTKSGYKVEYIRYFNFIGIFWWFLAGKIFKKENLPKMTGFFLKFVVPIFNKIESFIKIPIGQSLIIVAQK